MKASQISTVSHQVRIIRVSKPKLYPVEREVRVDSRIASSVDSWLSTAPSIEEHEVKKSSKKIVTQPSKNVVKQPLITKKPEDEHLFRRGCMAFGAIVIVILLICSIVGIVLAVKLDSTSVTTTPTSTIGWN